MQTFSKNERLCSKILIERLIETGKSFNHSPYRISWLPIAESSAPIKVVISVPKRSFKRAVDRNRLKRQTREIYRKHKQNVYDVLGENKLLVMIFYTAKTKLEFKELELKLKEALERLSKTVAVK
ncbi:MAG: ribonuclease P protein component [Bacteroidetes bacterium]|nr:ribonuclease P protein component [Bacteroidota bacterium]